MFHFSRDVFVAFLAASLSLINFPIPGIIQGVEVLLLKSGSHIIRIISMRTKGGFPIYLLQVITKQCPVIIAPATSLQNLVSYC